MKEPEAGLSRAPQNSDFMPESKQQSTMTIEQIDVDFILSPLHMCHMMMHSMTLTTTPSYFQSPGANSGANTSLNQIFDSYRGTYPVFLSGNIY